MRRLKEYIKVILAKLRRCLQTLIYHMFLSNIFNKAETFFPMNYEKWGALYITCCADRFICIHLQGYNVLFRKMLLFTNKSIIWSYFGYISFMEHFYPKYSNGEELELTMFLIST